MSMKHTVPFLSVLFVLAASTGAQERDLLVTSWNNNRVLRYDGQTGAFEGAFVTGGSGGLSRPHSACFGPDGHLYVTSFANDRVLRYDGQTGAFIDAFITPGLGGLDGPTSAAFGSDGALYVSSFNTPGVLRYDGQTGAFIDIFITPGNGLVAAEAGHFGPNGDYYLANGGSSNLKHYDGQTGAFVSTITGGSLTDPHDFVFGPNGNLFATAFGNRRVNEYDAQTEAFIGIFVSQGNGLLGAHGLYFDEVGFFYAAAFNNDRVIRYDGTTGAFESIFITDGLGGLDGPISITTIPLPPAESAYGCGVNPTGSLAVTAGQPAIGTQITFEVTNPNGTQNPGALGFIWLAQDPHPSFPCGAVAPGIGMGGPGSPGEFLLDFASIFVTFAGGPWGGVGSPVVFTPTIPPNLNLIGQDVFLQGVLIDLSGPVGGNTIGLTNALELLVGF